MSCEACELVRKKKEDAIYEDPSAYVFLPEKPTAKGHIRILSKKHVFSADDLKKEEIQHLFQIANFAASTLFDEIGAHGTNIILNEGSLFSRHLHIDVVARMQNDGLQMSWEPKEISSEAMESALSGIKDRADIIGQAPPPEIQAARPTPEPLKESEENYLFRHLKKIP